MKTPSGWNSYKEADKIKWYNDNGITPAQLKAAGVTQADIDYMYQHGYTIEKPTANNNNNNDNDTSDGSGQGIGSVKTPKGWNSFSAADKIKWYNDNGVTPAELLAAGVPQSAIDYMYANGYTVGKTTSNNSVSSGSSSDSITGGSGIDSLTSGSGNDSITSGSGNDSITSGSDSTVSNNSANNTSAGLPSLPSNLSSMTARQKADLYNQLLGENYTDAQIRQAAGTQSDADWKALQDLAKAPVQSAGLKYALANNMTEQQYLKNIENWLQANSNATDREVADQMVEYGISAEDLVRAHPSFKLDEVKQKLRDLGVQGYAEGGKARYLQGVTDGMADEIPSSIGGREPAALSHGEFVIPADVVSHLGNGNSDAGAKKLYQMMDKIRMARTGTKKQGKKINPDKFMPGGLAQAYAQGGAVKHFEGGGSTGVSGAVNAGVTGLESNLSNWAGPYVTNMLGKGMALANMPYQAYTGPLTAGQSALQEKVSTGLQGLDFPGNLGQSFTSTGTPTIGSDGKPVGGAGIASQYMNPYLQNVLNPQLEELRRQSQINLQPSLAKLTSAGGYGGGRQAIMESEANRNLLQEQNKTVGQGYANAYDKAMQQFNTEQGQAKTIADMMSGVGATDRAIEAEGIAADKAQFEEARENPFKMVQYQQSLLQGMPLASQAYNTTGESALVAAAKGATTVAELLKNLGIKVG